MKFVVVICCALLASVALPQDPVIKPAPGQPPAAPQDPAKLLEEVQKQFAQEGITIDAKTGTVAVKAVVNSPQDPIEYLLIHRKGKRHEAIFVTKAKPSVLNAALLMVGLEAGKNATYVEKVPAPTLEEVQNGVDPIIVTPPQGKPFWITVRWHVAPPKADGAPPEPPKDGETSDAGKAADAGEAGKPAAEPPKLVEHCVEDLILDRTTGLHAAECSWVFLGGRLAQLYRDEPEVFVADFEGNLISLCYLTPDNHLGTMVHARARDDENWWMTNLVPPAETEVEVVFHRTMPKLHQERLQRLEREKAAKSDGDAKPDDKKPDDKKPDDKPNEPPRGGQ